MKITDKLFHIFSNSNTRKRFFDDVITSLQSPNSQTEPDCIQKIVSNYQIIIEHLKKNTSYISLHPDDLSQITIDGKQYALDDVFSHSNGAMTECRMEIECLLADLTSQGNNLNVLIKRIETALNHAIRQQEK